MDAECPSLLPHLRQRISARACAMLWLLPNYLSLFIIWGSKALSPEESYRLPAYSAHYTVRVPLLSGDGTVMDCAFRFDVGQLDNDGNVC